MNPACAGTTDTKGESLYIANIGDQKFGANYINIEIESGMVRMGLSNAIQFEKFSGVGIVDAMLSRNDASDAKELFSELCKTVEDPIEDKYPMDAIAVFPSIVLATENWFDITRNSPICRAIYQFAPRISTPKLSTIIRVRAEPLYK